MSENSKVVDKAFWVLCGLSLIGVFFTVTYSHHGLLDYRQFRKETEALKARIQDLEEQNGELRRRLDLVRKPTLDLRERQARDYFNWVEDGDLIYFEDGTLAESQFSPRKPARKRN